MDSPLGRALLGKRAGDEFEIGLPAGAARMKVEAVEYPPSTPGYS